MSYAIRFPLFAKNDGNPDKKPLIKLNSKEETSRAGDSRSLWGVRPRAQFWGQFLHWTPKVVLSEILFETSFPFIFFFHVGSWRPFKNHQDYLKKALPWTCISKRSINKNRNMDMNMRDSHRLFCKLLFAPKKGCPKETIGNLLIGYNNSL